MNTNSFFIIALVVCVHNFLVNLSFVLLVLFFQHSSKIFHVYMQNNTFFILLYDIKTCGLSLSDFLNNLFLWLLYYVGNRL